MRILTFILNAYILRHVSKDVLGVINVRLLLLYTTVQFLSREGFRRACLSNTGTHNWAAVLNLVWLCLPVSVVIGLVMGYVWLFLLHAPDPLLVKNYPTGVYAMVVCVIIELLAEPLYIIGQSFQYVKLKVFIEGGSLALRCVLMSALIGFYPTSAVRVFSISQLSASLLYTSAFYTYFFMETQSAAERNDNSLPIKSLVSLIPFIGPNGRKIDETTAKLTWSFMKQTVFKQLLTEGERYIMTLFNLLSFAEQGVYDIVNNLGSLAARFIFQPIEENGYLFFAQILQRDVEVSMQKVEDIVLSATVLEHLLKLMVLLGTVILTFGQTYSKLLLFLYGGNILSEGAGPRLLRWHCVYVLFLALNGVTECFVFAAMTKKEIDAHNRRMAMFSVIFLASSYVLTSVFGGVGFIMANCLNMAARIVHGMFFINSYYRNTSHSPLKGLLPHTAVLTMCVLSYVVTLVTETTFCCDHGLLMWMIHVVLGGLCFLLVIFSIIAKERPLIAFLSMYWKDRHRDQDGKRSL